MKENALGRKLRGHTGRVLESDDYSIRKCFDGIVVCIMYYTMIT